MTGADQGIFKMAMLKPGTEEYFQSGEIIAGGDADQLKAAINGFYTSQYKVSPIVTRSFLDSAGDLTTEEAGNVFTVQYIIETPKALSAASVETIMLLYISSTASVDIVYPIDKQLSSPPLSGSFIVECFNTDGNNYASREMSISIDAAGFKNVLEADCSFLSGGISVQKLANNVMGIEFQIDFHGIVGELGQYKLHSAQENPLIGVDLIYIESVVRPFGKTLVWDVIPGDYFYTRETRP